MFLTRIRRENNISNFAMKLHLNFDGSSLVKILDRIRVILEKKPQCLVWFASVVCRAPAQGSACCARQFRIASFSTE